MLNVFGDDSLAKTNYLCEPDEVTYGAPYEDKK